MKYYKNGGKECIDSEAPKELSLQIALDEIDNLPFNKDNLIGFINKKEATIQFIRCTLNSWLIDVPVIKNGKYAYSLQEEDLTIENVKNIVKKFFLGENWQASCNLKKMM